MNQCTIKLNVKNQNVAAKAVKIARISTGTEKNLGHLDAEPSAPRKVYVLRPPNLCPSKLIPNTTFLCAGKCIDVDTNHRMERANGFDNCNKTFYFLSA